MSRPDYQRIQDALLRMEHYSQVMYDDAWLGVACWQASDVRQRNRLSKYLVGGRRGFKTACSDFRQEAKHVDIILTRRAVRAIPERRHRVFWCNQLKTYGLTKIQWLAMYHRQGGKCAICDACFVDIATPNLIYGSVTDHCHKTGAVRKLLCHKCNVELGYWEAKPWLIAKRAPKAIRAYLLPPPFYLKAWRWLKRAI